MQLFAPPESQTPIRDELTPKQRQIFAFIRRYTEEIGYPPAIRDIGREFDIKSPNGVMCHLRALQKKGFIHRDEKNEEEHRGGRARAITIPGVSAGGFTIPLLGRVAAGSPIAAVEQDERLDIRAMFGRNGTYALEVRGTSMIEDQIADGDYVVLQKRDTADNGQKVVAMVDGEMTLKKFFKRKNHVCLEPCNSSMQPIVVDPRRTDVRILGVFVGVMRVDRPGRVA